MKYKRALYWIRRDLRLSDNVALYNAIQQSKEVFPIFIFDVNILEKLQDKADRRVSFLADSLRELEKSLELKGSALIVKYGNPIDEIPKIVSELKIEAVFFNNDYEPKAKYRDAQIQKRLEIIGVDLNSYKDHVVFEHPEILTSQGTPYKVFTSYKNAWLKKFSEKDCFDFSCKLDRLASKKICLSFLWNWDLEKIGFIKTPSKTWAGENGAKKRLNSFKNYIREYDTNRNFPARANGTSQLSIYLRFGNISIRSLLRFALKVNSKGSQVWISELIWRDFYQTILDCFPQVVTKSFKTEFSRIKWQGKENHFRLWREGLTGYPLIDAAMRSFKKTGWMHNRLRMIVASFLTKDLLIDWKKGEAWFARNLLDFDLAANNGGWQWSASTGCDAQPYFRIFNPVTQSKKFDPDGKFIRSVIPELRGFSKTDIHWPANTNLAEQTKAKCIIGKDYPFPIVDHSIQRKKALDMYKEAKDKFTRQNHRL
jgi:deoxyribodipyrimidine photo-lyase